MRLRHKKPINSYVGQANADRNQAKDQDFIKTPISNYKTRLTKQQSDGQHNKKLAQILCYFINSVNTNYRKSLALNRQKRHPPQQKRTNSQEIYQFPENEKLKEVDLKQQQNIHQISTQVSKCVLTKKIYKQRLKGQQKNKIKCRKEKINVQAVQEKTLISKPKQLAFQLNKQQNLRKLKQNQELGNKLSSQPLRQGESQKQQMPNISQLQKLQQQMMQNPLYAFNPAVYSLYPYIFPPPLNYQQFADQFKANPFVNLGNFMNIMSPNYVPVSNLPFIRNQEAQRQKKQINSLVCEKPPVKSQTLTIQSKQPNKPCEKQESNRKIENRSQDFKGRSCYHISIAYNIHFNKLKESGFLETSSKQIDYQKLDPTYLAKKVRQRKQSDNIANINQNSTVYPH